MCVPDPPLATLYTSLTGSIPAHFLYPFTSLCSLHLAAPARKPPMPHYRTPRDQLLLRFSPFRMYVSYAFLFSFPPNLGTHAQILSPMGLRDSETIGRKVLSQTLENRIEFLAISYRHTLLSLPLLCPAWNTSAFLLSPRSYYIFLYIYPGYCTSGILYYLSLSPSLFRSPELKCPRIAR